MTHLQYPRPLQEYTGKTCDVLFLGEHVRKGEHKSTN